MSSNLLRLNPSKTEFYLPKSRKLLTLQYTSPITLLPLLSHLMPLSTILVLLLILIYLSPTTSPTSPAPASCTSVTTTASDPCLTLKPPPPNTSSAAYPKFTRTGCYQNTHEGIIISLLSLNHFTG